jgi:hypothetical protein
MSVAGEDRKDAEEWQGLSPGGLKIVRCWLEVFQREASLETA